MRQEELSRFEQAALAELFADQLSRGWVPSDADLRDALAGIRGRMHVEVNTAG